MVEVLNLALPGGSYVLCINTWVFLALLPAVTVYVLSRSWQRRTVQRVVRTVEKNNE